MPLALLRLLTGLPTSLALCSELERPFSTYYGILYSTAPIISVDHLILGPMKSRFRLLSLFRYGVPIRRLVNSACLHLHI